VLLESYVAGIRQHHSQVLMWKPYLLQAIFEACRISTYPGGKCCFCRHLSRSVDIRQTSRLRRASEHAVWHGVHHQKLPANIHVVTSQRCGEWKHL